MGFGNGELLETENLNCQNPFEKSFTNIVAGRCREEEVGIEIEEELLVESEIKIRKRR